MRPSSPSSSAVSTPTTSATSSSTPSPRSTSPSSSTSRSSWTSTPAWPKYSTTTPRASSPTSTAPPSAPRRVDHPAARPTPSFSSLLSPHFSSTFLSSQSEVLCILKKCEALGNPDEPRPSAVQKGFVHVRVNVCGSPLEFPESSPSIGKVRVKHRGILLTLKGTVIRSGGVKMIEGKRWYQCRKCNCRFRCYPELEAGNRITLPASCPSMSSKGCQSASFQLIGDSITCHDYQEIKIQESVQLLDVGSIPRSMPVILMDDLVDLVKAGDDVIVTGILSAKWSSDVKDVRCNLDPMFIANYVRRTNELKSGIDIPEEIIKDFELFWAENRATPLEGRNKILKGICPQIFGLFTVKLAVALTLIGGVQHVDASGTKVRGEPHMLLVGDPGTGKSQFLKFAAKLSNRSVITTGLGSTSAGLTVTAVKDGGEWMLEAGALVLADGGLCCIDEFDSMREHDRTTIHEAMEQQTISVAKAGLVTTLSTRTTVFGATNPKGQYDSNESLSVNTTLSGPLLSRFDIVLVLLDKKNPKLDGIISSHILAQSTKAEENKASDAAVKSTQPLGIKEWTLPCLRRYIHYVKQRFKPVLTKEAESVISGYYQLQRRDGTHNAARTTVRMLESLIRLAQAHARLMFRNEVTRLDAIAAILCIESSMTISAIIDGDGNALNSNFQENPDQEYIKEEQKIRDKLGDYLY
ncbi:probable DNA helicase MCM9 isoform X1 [Triticum aestivum]|uniref:probable DNA helicase MCM9 isoform X1 n=1 Tax=Triticum aestivum TaxID=4565 RepID=UPI001D01E33A|nr:probable DNA helicase MCM9 isoform X1 [Triticum aestivum]XP_044426554.1 probable DNA helicase MCM9 isoform X1 [Triticum aestivum]XP_044426555.1 probable DNA helicase MCM9 isoform X1 [Triticum aestivum]XP_044426556.1 probable DNA helicase MCM9 isoform X1 [Triticum aestivum]